MPARPKRARRSPSRGGSADPHLSRTPAQHRAAMSELAQVANHQVWLWEAVNRQRWIPRPGDQSPCMPTLWAPRVSQTWAATIMQSAGSTPSSWQACRYTDGDGLKARTDSTLI